MALLLRRDFDARHLRAAARQSKNAARARRLLTLARAYDGGMRTKAARIGEVTVPSSGFGWSSSLRTVRRI